MKTAAIQGTFMYFQIKNTDFENEINLSYLRTKGWFTMNQKKD